MMADHGEACNGEEATYCMNGGTCYKIPSMNSLSCVCYPNYTGSRCENLRLFSSSPLGENAGLIAAVVIVALLILLALAVFIYYIRKMLKARQQSQQSQQNSQPQYWKVQSMRV
ncbi:pro-neuregulin-4, membrane-bound isoform [Sphaeramia orbicularis]|uniref:EGF-like domain-containing protein n=1 Tax=Sphaeramia orbicularis TaxID=375764 RepID=A0A673CSS0_9TELE|nr:pro-neuregulin-4, membrane-bound isoform [Sphaeramia orbicularis]